MAKADDIKARVRAGLSAVRRGLASGAKATALGARRLGRRAAAMSSAERRAFCARTAPERGEAQILAAVNKAVRMAYQALGKPVRQIETGPDGVRIGTDLRMTVGKTAEAKAARLAGDAAYAAGLAMLGGDRKLWDRAGEYADDAIDLGGSI